MGLFFGGSGRRVHAATTVAVALLGFAGSSETLTGADIFSLNVGQLVSLKGVAEGEEAGALMLALGCDTRVRIGEGGVVQDVSSYSVSGCQRTKLLRVRDGFLASSSTAKDSYLWKTDFAGNVIWAGSYSNAIIIEIDAFQNGDIAVLDSGPSGLAIGRLTGSGNVLWWKNVACGSDGTFGTRNLAVTRGGDVVAGACRGLISISGEGELRWYRRFVVQGIGLPHTSSTCQVVVPTTSGILCKLWEGGGITVSLDDGGSPTSWFTGPSPASDANVLPLPDGGALVADSSKLYWLDSSAFTYRVRDLPGVFGGGANHVFRSRSGDIVLAGEGNAQGIDLVRADSALRFPACVAESPSPASASTGYRIGSVAKFCVDDPFDCVLSFEPFRAPDPVDGSSSIPPDLQASCQQVGTLATFTCTITNGSSYSGRVRINGLQFTEMQPGETVTRQGSVENWANGVHTIYLDAGSDMMVYSRSGTLSLQNVAIGKTPQAIFRNSESIASNLRCSEAPPTCTLPPDADSDADGLKDCDELFPIVDGISDEVLLDLPALGADPERPDIFVECDFLERPAGNGKPAHSHRPSALAMKAAIAAFESSPSSADGARLHIDYGQWGERSESDAIQSIPGYPLLDDILLTPGGGFSIVDSIQIQDRGDGRPYFSNSRRGRFHYCLFGHSSTETSEGLTSGQSDGIPGPRFVVSLGEWARHVGTTNEQAGTLLHELGHNLGLRHGGLSNSPGRRTNYLSVMNHSYQMALLDYSRAALPILNETNLNEAIGIQSPSWAVHWCGAPQTSCQGEDCFWFSLSGLRIDWDCDGTMGEVVSGVDTNGDGDPAGSLLGAEDWSRLVFPFYEPLAATLMGSPDGDELSRAEDARIPKPYALSAAGPDVILSGAPAPNLFIAVTNQGKLADTYDLAIFSTNRAAVVLVNSSASASPGGVGTLTANVSLPANSCFGFLEARVRSRAATDLAQDLLVLVKSSAPQCGLFADSFEFGSTIMWSSTSP